ncbi:MAG: hypothetical protein LBJ00_02905 [Planctomycetaceae bacterium]|nr:hypothetical protein [Planctomycetaceae bacterium]
MKKTMDKKENEKEKIYRLRSIPKPVWAVGFAHEQPLRDATLACPASGISKQLGYISCIPDRSKRFGGCTTRRNWVR